jgi:hypothetical protein
MITNLQDLLILLRMSFLDLLRGAHIVLQISNSMFPSLQALGQERGSLYHNQFYPTHLVE